jgi:hypothetical protein
MESEILKNEMRKSFGDQDPRTIAVYNLIESINSARESLAESSLKLSSKKEKLLSVSSLAEDLKEENENLKEILLVKENAVADKEIELSEAEEKLISFGSFVYDLDCKLKSQEQLLSDLNLKIAEQDQLISSLRQSSLNLAMIIADAINFINTKRRFLPGFKKVKEILNKYAVE